MTHKGSISIIALVLGALALLGVASSALKLPPFGSQQTVTPIAPGSAASVDSLSVTGTATSSFSGGIDVLTVGGFETQSGAVISGGSLLATNIGAIFGSTTVSGITSSGGVSITAGCYLQPNGTCLGAGANPGGSANQFQYQVNGTTFGGSANLLFNSSGNIGVGTATPGAILSVEGEVLIDGSLRVGNLTATGTPKLGGITYPTTDGTNGQALTTNGSGVTSFTTVGGSATFGILTCPNSTDGATNECRVITDVASGTLAVTGIPARSNLEFIINIPSMFGGGTSSPTLVFNGATSTDGQIHGSTLNFDDLSSANRSSTSTLPLVGFHATSFSSPRSVCNLTFGCTFQGSIKGTSTARKWIKWTPTTGSPDADGAGGQVNSSLSVAMYDNSSQAIHEIRLSCGQGGQKCDAGTEIIISGYSNAP